MGPIIVHDMEYQSTMGVGHVDGMESRWGTSLSPGNELEVGGDVGNGCSR